MQYRESISQGHYEKVNLFCEVQILAKSIPYLNLVGRYCNSSGNGDLWMVAVSLETENPSVIRNCRFESGWHGFDWQGSIPCAAIYLNKMACEYDKNIVEYLYQTKDTESHEDSDFCYDWGMKYGFKLRELWRTNRNR